MLTCAHQVRKYAYRMKQNVFNYVSYPHTRSLSGLYAVVCEGKRGTCFGPSQRILRVNTPHFSSVHNQVFTPCFAMTLDDITECEMNQANNRTSSNWNKFSIFNCCTSPTDPIVWPKTIKTLLLCCIWSEPENIGSKLGLCKAERV